MTADRDMTRVVRSWLRVDEHESADRVLETVLSRLETTPQRRSWWPARRDFRMNLFTKAAIGAAAVAVVALVGLQLLPTSNIGSGGPTPTPAVTPPATATPRPTVKPVLPPIPSQGPLTVGRHPLTLEDVPFTLEIATSGWTSNGDFGFEKGPPGEPGGSAFIFWGEDPNFVFTDSCGRTKGPTVGPTAADMAAAIAGMSQLELVSGPTSMTLGGKPAAHVVVRVPDEIPCSPEQFYLWGDNPPGGDAERYATEPGFTVWVWIIEVDGKRLQIDGETYDGAGPEVGEELAAIVESIEFE